MGKISTVADTVSNVGPFVSPRTTTRLEGTPSAVETSCYKSASIAWRSALPGAAARMTAASVNGHNELSPVGCTEPSTSVNKNEHDSPFPLQMPQASIVPLEPSDALQHCPDESNRAQF